MNQTSLTPLQNKPHSPHYKAHLTTNQTSLTTLQTNPHSPHHEPHLTHASTPPHLISAQPNSFWHDKLHHTLTSQITFHSDITNHISHQHHKPHLTPTSQTSLTDITNHISLRHHAPHLRHQPHQNPINNAFAEQVWEEQVLNTVLDLLAK